MREDRGWLARRLRARAARHWAAMAGALDRGGRPVDPRLHDEARRLQSSLTRILHIADARLPRGRDSLALMELPPGTDWRWRPAVFCGRIAPAVLAAPGDRQRLSDEATLFHDCPHRALILRQRRNGHATDLAEYGLTLEAMGFSGSYLSLSLDLPAAALSGLGAHHVLRLDSAFQAERPITIYGRLNLQQGPNTETMLRQLGDPVAGGPCGRLAEFDLGYADIAPGPVDRAWLDLLFEAPHMNAVTLSDVVLSRYPRAQV